MTFFKVSFWPSKVNMRLGLHDITDTIQIQLLCLTFFYFGEDKAVSQQHMENIGMDQTTNREDLRIPCSTPLSPCSDHALGNERKLF